MEPESTPDYQFNSRSYGNPIYNRVVSLLFKRTVLLGTGLILLFGLTITGCLLLIPQPHHPLQYMVAGSVATAVALIVGFVLLNRMPNAYRPVVKIRIARRSGQ